MAIVYANLDAIPKFQEELEIIYQQLCQQANCKEDLILRTNSVLEEKIYVANQVYQAAEEAHFQAARILSEQESLVAEMNRNRDPETNPDPYVVSSSLYDMVDYAAEQCSMAQASVNNAYDNMSSYADFCDYYRKRQQSLLDTVAHLLQKSDSFFEEYSQILKKSKSVITQGDTKRSNGRDTNLSGVTYSNTRELTDAEVISLAEKTGWSETMIRQKCVIGKDGNVHFKANN